ncbi:hypothetical protein [Pseudarthrobacter sp. NamB4]|uniref:hypothetical protein n=1 Tax=Pseudarthrobacter sp. NamB4 TaxID=2576837 RepID=UPI00197B06E9|nr:hypothetical protein [Pseudarthrobacter sp. NamB4]
MVRIVEYKPEYRAEALALSLRAWKPVFPLVRHAVPESVYEAFYPMGWEERQYRDMMMSRRNQVVGWVCTRLAERPA